MVPGKYDIKIFRGATWSISVDAKSAVGTNLDFSVYDEIQLQVSKSWNRNASSTSLLTLTLANGRIALVNTNQTIQLTLTAAETAALQFNEGVYELELIKDATVDPVAAKVVDRMLYGSVAIANETVL